MSFKVTDLCDEFAEKARVFRPIFTDFGAHSACFGEALTVKCFEDNSRVKELSACPGLGRVLVIDARGSERCAIVGDLIAGDLCNNGWAGMIIYGYVRDSAELAKLPIVIKALGVVPRRSQRRGEGQIGEPIEFANQRIECGDRIYADQDGIIILNERTGK